MSEINYVLDYSNFEKQIVRTIPKVENNFKYKYNQQYGQSNQSTMTSNTIRTTPGVVLVILLVALTQRPETRAKAWCSGGWFTKINSKTIPNSIC